MNTKFPAALAAILLTLALAACSRNPDGLGGPKAPLLTEKEKSVVSTCAAGALLGAIVTRNPWQGAAIGCGVGAGVGVVLHPEVLDDVHGGIVGTDDLWVDTETGVIYRNRSGHWYQWWRNERAEEGWYYQRYAPPMYRLRRHDHGHQPPQVVQPPAAKPSPWTQQPGQPPHPIQPGPRVQQPAPSPHPIQPGPRVQQPAPAPVPPAVTAPQPAPKPGPVAHPPAPKPAAPLPGKPAPNKGDAKPMTEEQKKARPVGPNFFANPNRG